jgi:hypothetical protein
VCAADGEVYVPCTLEKEADDVAVAEEYMSQARKLTYLIQSRRRPANVLRMISMC